ncbi:substrate-binding domain-containing protein [Anaeroselena agilis]|uniref:Substrate-binding domain-containing protein n=1 Tax=Anaeroselena agilis TaxID=3063788 RepID=A0ABU3NWX2_9FIRM|nr:substrate-binding domain-containing protein [Selenomonadales bacterium 4137-cl]
MLIPRNAMLAAILCLILAAGCSGPGSGPSPTKPAADAKPAGTGRFIVAGSGTNLPITVKLAAAYNKKAGNTVVEVPKSIGTSGAIKAVQEGALELGLVSRSLTAGEKASGLNEIPYAKVAIIFAAHPDVPDNDVTLDDIVRIHRGEKTAWSDGRPIIVLIRGLHDSSNLTLFKLIPGFADAIKDSVSQKRWQVMYHDIDMANSLRTKQGAFGHTDSTEIKINGGIKPLSINGVASTDDNIRSGRYPYVKPLSFIYKGTLTERAKAFIAFVASREGQAVISENGGTPPQ